MFGEFFSVSSLAHHQLPPPGFEEDPPASLLNASLDSSSSSSESNLLPSLINSTPEKRNAAFLSVTSFLQKHSGNLVWTHEEQIYLIELFINAPKLPWDYLIELTSFLIRDDNNWTPDNKIELLEIFSKMNPVELEDLVRFTDHLTDRKTYTPEDILATLILLAGLESEKRKHFTEQLGDFFQRACLQRQKIGQKNLSPMIRLLLCDQLIKLAPSDLKIVFDITLSLLANFVGSELCLLKTVIRCYDSKERPLEERLQADFLLQTSLFLSKKTSFPSHLKKELEVFLDAEDDSIESSYLIERSFEILDLAKIEDPKETLRQIAPLFTRGVWDSPNRLLALELLAQKSSLEKTSLIRQVLLLQGCTCQDVEGILKIIKALLQIESPFREDVVQKTVRFIGENLYETEETIDAIQMIDEIGEFDRPSILRDLQIALPENTLATDRNLFLKFFSTLGSKERKSFIESLA